MNKALEALDSLLDYAVEESSVGKIGGLLYHSKEYEKYYETVETELKEKEKQDKILRIIKDKKVAFDELFRCIEEEKENALEEYNNFAGDENSLTQTEFDLLKERFK